MNPVRAPKRNRRTLGRAVKGQPTRRRILRVLKRRKGLGPAKLARMLGVANSTVDHHLTVLAEHKLVASRTSARRAMWFLGDTKPAQMEATLALRRWRRRQIAHAILRRPGVMQKDLVRRLRVSRKVFRESMNPLVDQGWVVEAVEGRSRRYFPTRRLRAAADVVRRQDS